MRLPRFILNTIRSSPDRLLYERERRETNRLRAELKEWQDRCLEQARIRPLFQSLPTPTPPVIQPPVGTSAKRAYIASQRSGNEPLTAEEVTRPNGNH
jgi:hypothetical protein